MITQQATNKKTAMVATMTGKGDGAGRAVSPKAYTEFDELPDDLLYSLSEEALAEYPPDDVRPAAGKASGKLPEANGHAKTDSNNPYAAQARTAYDCLLNPLPIKPSVIGGLFPKSSLSIVYGYSGVGKTNAMLDAMVSVAMGESCWRGLPGKFNSAGFAVSQCPALLIDADTGPELLDERVAAHMRGHGAPEDTPVSYLSYAAPAISAARGLKLLTAYAKDIGAGLIVLDNLLRLAGVDDENSSKMDAAMMNLRQFAIDTGAAVVVIHHRRKDSSGREGDSLRGHSSIEASLDSAFLVTSSESSGQPILTIRPTKSRRKPAKPFSLAWAYEYAEDGESLHSARFWQVGVGAGALELKILAALADGPKNTNEICAIVGGNKKAVCATLAAMQLAKSVKCESSGNAKIYSLPD